MQTRFESAYSLIADSVRYSVTKSYLDLEESRRIESMLSDLVDKLEEEDAYNREQKEKRFLLENEAIATTIN